MTTRGERLREARKAAGYRSADAAAAAMGMAKATYGAHERAETPGGRDYGPDEAKRYSRKFKVEDIWLLTGKGRGPKGEVKGQDSFDRALYLDTLEAEQRANKGTVPLVGYVGAGAEAHFYAVSQSSLDPVPAPMNANDASVAVEIRGDSLGAMFDRWLVYYDDVRSPVTADLIGRLCVVGLPNEKILVKKIRKSALPGRYDLHSETEPPILDQEILWAAKVKQLTPQ